MTRKQIIAVFGLVVSASILSAAIAYHYGRLGFVGPFGQTPGAVRSELGECIDFRDAGSLVGKQGCVSGRVLRVFTSRAGHTFLDFCPDYRQCPFTSVVFASDRGRFGDLGKLTGRQVEIRGPVTTYQGRAEIILNDPQQIREIR